MAIFFDQEWFDAQLSAAGMTRDSLAIAAGMTPDEMDLVFLDQREVEDQEVAAIARVLRADRNEVADRCGVSPSLQSWDPPEAATNGVASAPKAIGASPIIGLNREAIGGLHERLDRVEQLLERVLTKLEHLERR